jgi:hypothetical protein
LFLLQPAPTPAEFDAMAERIGRECDEAVARIESLKARARDLSSNSPAALKRVAAQIASDEADRMLPEARRLQALTGVFKLARQAASEGRTPSHGGRA